MAVMKVRTEIIDSIAASTIGQALKLVIMYVESFKTSANAFIGKVIISLKSHRLLEINGKMSKLPMKINSCWSELFFTKKD
jgi:hypothetical protein